MTKPSILALGILLGVAPLGNATVVGFGQLGGSNTAVPGSLASNAVSDGAGYVVTNGTTPDIALVWDVEWDIHQSLQFAPLEGKTVGGGDWDNEGNTPRVGQLEKELHNITFNVEDDDVALVLNSFDFAHTGETAGTTKWTLTLSDSSSNIAWTENFTFVNGNVFTVAPNFTGQIGEDYTLAFTMTESTYTAVGRHGIDNLSFNQVPEPSTAGLLSLAAVGLLSRRRSRTQSAA